MPISFVNKASTYMWEVAFLKYIHKTGIAWPKFENAKMKHMKMKDKNKIEIAKRFIKKQQPPLREKPQKH